MFIPKYRAMKTSITALLGSLLILGGVSLYGKPAAAQVYGSATADGTPVKGVPESNLQVQLSYSPVVKETAPAVVNVFTSRTVTRRARTSFFDEMFGARRAPQ